jgi:hypothetical protein
MLISVKRWEMPQPTGSMHYELINNKLMDSVGLFLQRAIDDIRKSENPAKTACDLENLSVSIEDGHTLLLEN